MTRTLTRLAVRLLVRGEKKKFSVAAVTAVLLQPAALAVLRRHTTVSVLLSSRCHRCLRWVLRWFHCWLLLCCLCGDVGLVCGTVYNILSMQYLI